MSIVLLCIFGALAAAHVIIILIGNRRLQAITKICLLPVLALYYYFSAGTFLAQVLFALFFGWIGDLFLIKIRKPYFAIVGIFSFLAGHICYILSMLTFITTIKVTALVISIIVIFCFELRVFVISKPEKKMLIPALCYGLIIAVMFVCALQIMLCLMNAAGFIIFAGSICFIVSDSFLAYYSFRKMTKRVNFLIMLTYITAQACIVVGIGMN
ncbi:hypothetical protein AGMMS49942_27150 [Spirochaetia bacterium]|nr:hypothetical protein AGMMS49942_27150 [Spirochaetia bacterium]